MSKMRFRAKRIDRVVTRITNKIKPYARAVLLYGSYSLKSPAKPRPASDVDLFVIYKKQANIYSLSALVEDIFEKSRLPYDYSWYGEEYFLDLIGRGIDYFLFREILSSGEIVYADTTFLK